MFRRPRPCAALLAALLLAPALRAEHETTRLIPGTAELAVFVDLPHLIEIHPAIARSGRLAEFARFLREQGDFDLLEAGIETVGLGLVPVGGGRLGALVAVGRADDPPSPVMGRIAEVLASREGYRIVEEPYRGSTILFLEGADGARESSHVDLPEGDGLAATRYPAVVAGGVDTYLGRIPNFQEDRAPRWGTNVTGDFTLVRVHSIPRPEILRKLADLGLSRLAGLEELAVEYFHDPEYVNGGTFELAFASASQAAAAGRELEAARAALLERLPPDAPWRAVLEQSVVHASGKVAVLEAATIPGERIEDLLMEFLAGSRGGPAWRLPGGPATKS